MKTVYAVLLSSFFLCSCSITYQNAVIRDFPPSTGYSDEQVGTDLFYVGFNGNSFTSYGDAYKFALCRASEVTTAHGFPYFEVLERINASIPINSGVRYPCIILYVRGVNTRASVECYDASEILKD